MIELLLSFIAGMICGSTFTALKLPIPVPQVLGGVLGIVGIFVGYTLVGLL